MVKFKAISVDGYAVEGYGIINVENDVVLFLEPGYYVLSEDDMEVGASLHTYVKPETIKMFYVKG